MNRTLKISGMSCNHCVAAVQEALEQIPGVTDVNVSLDQGSASISATQDSISNETLSDAVKKAGYQVESIS